MEGFILAAGLGSRLRPLTDHRPKALVELGGRTLLELAIRRLEEAGVQHIVVNVHHHADMVVDFLSAHRWQCRIDISDERDKLLDTGGALRHAAPLFSHSQPVLVHNVDILSHIDFSDLQRRHQSDGNLATLCVSRRHTSRLLNFDSDGLLLGRTSDAASGLAFSGIALVSPALFPLLPDPVEPYPIIEQYIRLSAMGHRVAAYEHSPQGWLDVGKPETLSLAQQWTLS